MEITVLWERDWNLLKNTCIIKHIQSMTQHNVYICVCHNQLIVLFDRMCIAEMCFLDCARV